MSEEIFPPDFGDQLARTFRQTMGSLSELMEERFEYQAAPDIETVNLLARGGWTLATTYNNHSGTWFVMQRKLGAADAATELLRQASRAGGPGMPPGWTPPSTPGDTPDNSQES